MKYCLSLLVLISITAQAQLNYARYNLVRMDKAINTFHHEAAPVVSPDGNTLYFFVQDHPENTMGKEDTQDIWVSKKDDKGVWGPPKHLSAPFNIHRSNQVFTVLPDGSLFIKGGKAKGSNGFSIASAGGGLREVTVRDFQSMNKGRFYGASISQDLKHIIMYFSEVAKSVNSDLYASHLQPDGTYSRPVKLALSTVSDDLGPFISPDQKTLYFASGQASPDRLGLVDIYRCDRLDDTWANWSAPVNLGKPVNTSALDYYFTIDQDGYIYTSRATKGFDASNLDLYQLTPKNFKIDLTGTVFNQKTNEPLAAQVEIVPEGLNVLKTKATDMGSFSSKKIPEVQKLTVRASMNDFQPNEVVVTVPLLVQDTSIQVEIPLTPKPKALIISGRVFDKKTENLVEAKIDMVSKSERKSSSFSATEGRFEQPIQKLGWYVLTASAPGYLNTTDSLRADNAENTPFTKDLYLTPIEVGVTVILKNIYFDFDKTTLQKKSFVELNKVVDLLKKNPSVEIEISGHTDSKGSDDYNLNLSQGRSQAVVDYIISQGIESSRLTAHGYGETKPIDSNETDAGRANNRRVEFTILKK